MNSLPNKFNQLKELVLIISCGYSGTTETKLEDSFPIAQFNLLRKSMDWFLYDIGLRHERVKFMNSQNHLDLT